MKTNIKDIWKVGSEGTLIVRSLSVLNPQDKKGTYDQFRFVIRSEKPFTISLGKMNYNFFQQTETGLKPVDLIECLESRQKKVIESGFTVFEPRLKFGISNFSDEITASPSLVLLWMTAESLVFELEEYNGKFIRWELKPDVR